MSEVDSRPPATRGRSSYRGGRGASGRGGPRGGSRKPTNGTTTDTLTPEESLEDQGEIGEMKKKYSSEVSMLKDMFPDWSDVDLVFALQEADGDITSTVDKITQGNVSQFAEVKSAKDRARSKVKEAPAGAGSADKSATRGGRGRGGADSTRGARGRASDRGRGGFRGARGGHATTNGTTRDAAAASVPTTESTAWDDSTPVPAAGSGWDDSAPDTTKTDGGQGGWGSAATADSTPAAASEGAKSALIPEGGSKKSWASMFAAPKPAPPAAKKPQEQAPPAESVAPEEVAEAKEAPLEETSSVPSIHEPPPEPAAPIETPAIEEPASIPDTAQADTTAPKLPLTEENVEHLPDDSHAPATATAASTAGSMDPRNLTPLPGQQPPIGRPPLGGYATSASRAAGGSGRSASYLRRVQEQQEAVVMPGHNAVDRAAVQFGSMGLNGEPGPDVDEDREEPETRQAPQHSPPSQPRAALPPAPRQPSTVQESAAPESLPTPKQAPGLPPASHLNQQQLNQQQPGQHQMPETSLPSGLQSETPQMSQNYNQYGGRYGQPTMQQDAGAQQQKPYDPFSHQAPQSHYDQYGTHTQQSQQAPQHAQQSHAGLGGLSSAPNDMSHYYTSEQQRSAYANYYGGGYGPQDARTIERQNQQDAGQSQQRSASGFGAGPNESAFPSQAQQQQAQQSRFADASGSGNNTPNPLMGGPQHNAAGAHQSQQNAHQASGQPQHPAYSAQGYPYGHPYYVSPYQQAYQNQYGNYGQQQQQLGGYGGGNTGGYPAKQAGMYGQSHGYGMGPQSSYDQHSASPANTSAFGQNQQQQSVMRSASGMSSGLGSLDDYGRSSAQSHQQSSGFGGMNDAFTRSTSGFGGVSGYGQQSMAGQEDSLKPYSDNKGGPSPALGQPGARPGSAANNAVGAGQSGLPPPQSQHTGFGGGYGGFQGQSQYGSLGGLGGQQQAGQQGMGGQGGYGSYGAGSGFNQYGQYSRGNSGWGSQYGAH